MFWGLILEPKKRYSQTVLKPFHISMAALDVNTSTEDPTQVMLTFENKHYLLCTLQTDSVLQVPLDLNFDVGDSVVFATNGNSNIHLSGYIIDEPEDDEEDGEEDGEEDENCEDVEEEEEVEEELPNPDLITAGKRKPKPKLDNSPPSKKSKLSALIDDLATSYNSDEDSTFQASFEEANSSSEDEDDDDSVKEDEETEEEEDDDEDEEETVPPRKMQQQKSQVNGVSKKDQTKAQKKLQESQVTSQKNSKQGQTPEKTPKQAKTPKESKTPKLNEVAAKQEKTPKQQQNEHREQPGSAQKRVIDGGLVIQDLKEGEGKVAKPGKMVQVYYEGRLKQNNKVFDSSKTGNGFRFRLGRQEVIKGWDAGIAGMKVGGKRRLTCPPVMAYGAKGSPPVIPPNSTLVFDVELKNVS